MIATLLLGAVIAAPLAAAEPAAVACEVSGYDVLIRNTGTKTIPAGTVLNWSVPFVRQGGEHVLAEPMLPDGAVFLSAILGSDFLHPAIECVAGVGV